MSRIEENTEMQKRLVELSDIASKGIFDEKGAISINLCFISEIMKDISISLAVIADKMTEKSEEK